MASRLHFHSICNENAGRLWKGIHLDTKFVIHNSLPEKEDFMSYLNKPFEELDVLDNFLINAIATDAEVGEAFCRKVPRIPRDTDGCQGRGI